jgi:hypothetical protein
MKVEKDFKIRASAASNIMGVKALGKTGQSYLQEWVKEQVYGRRKQISSKYLLKGLEMEDKAIELLSNELFDGAMIFKNEEHFESDYFTGTPDIIFNDKIIDIKCSWDCMTFPLFETELPSKEYFFQAQVYMDLVGVEKYEVIYCLMDTPDDLLYGDDPTYHQYSNVPTEYRIKRFNIDRDEEAIDKLKARVLESREYINSL